MFDNGNTAMAGLRLKFLVFGLVASVEGTDPSGYQ